MSNEKLKNRHTFSRTNGEILFVNNFDKYTYIVLTIVAVAYSILYYPNSLIGTVFFVAAVIPFILLFSFHFSKTAHKLVIDIRNQSIDFHMFRKKGIITKKISDIKKVQNGGYIIFFFYNGNKIYWKKRNDDEVLIDILKQIALVESRLI